MKMFNNSYHISNVIAGIILILFLPTSIIAQDSLSDLIGEARSVGIEQSKINALQERAAQRGISDAELIAIIRPAVSMAERNLPSEMIFDKAFEGLSKGVPFQQIEPMLGMIAENSMRVAGIVDPWIERAEIRGMLERGGYAGNQQKFRNEMIKAGSKTLRQNFSEEVFQETIHTIADQRGIEQRNPGTVVAAANILSDLPSAAENPTESARIILRALEGGFEASDLQNLPRAMNMAQRRSEIPAGAVLEGVSRQLQGGLPAEQILQNLFNGNIGGGPPGGTPPGLNRGDRDRRGPPGNNG